MQSSRWELMVAWAVIMAELVEWRDSNQGYLKKNATRWKYNLRGPVFQVFPLTTHRYTFSLLLRLFKILGWTDTVKHNK